jgi:hypothetical protein
MVWWEARVEDRFGLTDYPRLDEREITLLHRLDWWDGPLNGTIAYRGEVFWFDFYHFDRDTSPYAYLDPVDRHYFYLVFPLTQAENEECEHRLAQNKERARRYIEQKERGTIPPDERWLGPDLGNREPCGWFMDGANPEFYAIQVHRGMVKPTDG